jgi:YD repeat-containing protein
MLSGWVCDPLPYFPPIPPGGGGGGGSGDPHEMLWTTTSPGLELSRSHETDFRQNPPYTPQTSRAFSAVPGWAESWALFALGFMQAANIQISLNTAGIHPTPVSSTQRIAVPTGPVPLLVRPDVFIRPSIAQPIDDPVDLATGALIYGSTDLSLPGFGVTFSHRRVYSSRVAYDGPQGVSWDHQYDQRLFHLAGRCLDDRPQWQTGQNGAIRFDKVYASGSNEFGHQVGFRTSSSARYELTCVDTPSSRFQWYLDDKLTGERRFFYNFENTQVSYLSTWKDRHGLGLTLAWDAGAAPRLRSVTDAAGRQIDYSYTPQGRLREVKHAASGLVATYTYDAAGDLKDATAADGHVEHFVYSAAPPNAPPSLSEWNVREGCQEACEDGTACAPAVLEARAACEAEGTTTCIPSCRRTG